MLYFCAASFKCLPRGCLSSRWWLGAFLDLELSMRTCKGMRDPWEQPSAQTCKREVQEEGMGRLPGEAESLDELSEVAQTRDLEKRGSWLWQQESFSPTVTDPPVLSNGQTDSFLRVRFFFFFLPTGMQYSWHKLGPAWGLLQSFRYREREKSDFCRRDYLMSWL